MKKSILLFLIFCIPLPLFAGGHQEENKQVIVFAPASTVDLLEKAAVVYSQTSAVEIKLNPASSGTCAKQLAQGAFADIFISASGKWIEYVDELGLLSQAIAFMTNSLVVIAPTDSIAVPFEIDLLTAVPEFTGRISIADPAHAPAGKYAVEAMKSCRWYDALSSRILPEPDVRRALSVVEFGEAELGIVYKTDAKKSKKVKILAEFPEDSHSPIRYYCALTREATEAGADFFEFLTGSAEMTKLIEDYRFISSRAK